jgi:SAM-dependent methyltransferase
MNCRICDKTDLWLAVDFGMQPWCNHFLRREEIGLEPFYPLRLVFCHNCRTAQLDYTVPKEVMFSDHTYLSGVTNSLSNHFKRVAQEVDDVFFKDVRQKSVLDIGSNDGTQLKHFKARGYDVLGVESSKTTARIANEAGIPTLNKFFNLETLRSLGRKFSVINAAGVFFHLEELHSVTEAIREGLSDDGVFVVQFLYMKKIVENVAFDQIYHEHLVYYNLETIETLLRLHGLSMFDAYLSPIHGGSIVGYAAHAGRREASPRLSRLREAETYARSNELETYMAFADSISQLKAENLAYLADAKSKGKTIFGLGAPVKGNTLLNYFKIGTHYIDYLVEKNHLRRGLFSPGMHIPVVLDTEVQEQPDIYYVLAWNFKDEILANSRDLIAAGVEFYFPISPKDERLE